ncbi:MAG: Ig-like domain-containing protein [Lachnospiraceae bacterium]|nr:Ig-like domain-containing protein [Lachnospiraceae bacterium]
MKRIIAFLLSIVMVMTLFNGMPEVVRADNYGDDYYYEGELGAIYSPEATTFRYWNPNAESVSLCLAPLDNRPMEKVMEGENWTGVWTVTIYGDVKNINYYYDVDGNIVADPYGQSSDESIGSTVADLSSTDPSGWENDVHVFMDEGDLSGVMAYIDIASFSSDEMTSGIRNDYLGKYSALTEKGTTVENAGCVPTCLEHLKAALYDSICIDIATDGQLMLPDKKYAYNPWESGASVREVKQMIMALHNEGIGVDLQLDFSNAPFEGKMLEKYVVDTCSYWINEYHIDGIVLKKKVSPATETKLKELVSSIDSRILLAGITEKSLVDDSYLNSWNETNSSNSICSRVGTGIYMYRNSLFSRSTGNVDKYILTLMAMTKGKLTINLGQEFGGYGDSIDWSKLGDGFDEGLMEPKYSDTYNYFRKLLAIREVFSPLTKSVGATSFTAGGNNRFAVTMTNSASLTDEWQKMIILSNSGNTAWNYGISESYVIIANGTTVNYTSGLGTCTGSVNVPKNTTMILVDKSSFNPAAKVSITYYDAVSDTMLSSISIDKGGQYTFPVESPITAPSGYAFSGRYNCWGDSDSYIAVAGTSKIITEDMTIQPVWEKAYDVYVGNTRITESNKDDVLGDADGESQSVKFDPETNTLTLNNANISEAYEYKYGYEAMIYSELSDLFIKLVGNNTLESTNTYADGIDAAGGCDVTIIGDGTLSINNAYYGTYIGSYDVPGGNLTIMDGAKVIVTDSSAAGVWVNHDINITDSEVIIDRKSMSYNGMVASTDGTISVTNSDVNIKNSCSAILLGNADGTTNKFVINSGTVTIDTDYYGIEQGTDPYSEEPVINATIEINGGKLDITAGVAGTNITSVNMDKELDYSEGTDLGYGGRIVIEKPQVHVHNYEADVHAPSCTEGGYTTYTCSGCGDSYTDDYTMPLGHCYGEHDKTCPRCGAVNPDYVEPPTTEPVTTEPVTTVPATTEQATTVAPTTELATTVAPTKAAETTTAVEISPEDAKLENVEAAEVKIVKTNTDIKDVKGTEYKIWMIKATTKKKTITLKWKQVKGADGYIIYGSRCGTKMQRIKTLTNSKAKKYTVKNLLKGKFYKYMVVAYKNTAVGEKVISKSKSVHLTTSGGKYDNPKGIKLVKSIFTLKKGKSVKIKGNIKYKGVVPVHVSCFRYECTDNSVVAVNKNGRIKAKKKGKATIYVYTQNGICKKVSVTVK